MKWIGQQIYDQVSRFRDDVYLENIVTGTIVSGGHLGLDSNNKIVKAVDGGGDIKSVSVESDGLGMVFANGNASFTIAGGSGITTSVSGATLTVAEASPKKLITDIDTLTGVTATNLGTFTGNTIADSRDIKEALQDLEEKTETVAAAGAKGIVELATTAETNTGSDAARVVTPDGLNDWTGGAGAVTKLGTIATGVWEGTVIASDQQKHVAHYEIVGTSEGDGTNFKIPVDMFNNKGPYNHTIANGSDGLTALTVQSHVRGGGHVMPRTAVLKSWKGWAAGSGSGGTAGDISIMLLKVTPANSSSSSVVPIKLDTIVFESSGNGTSFEIDETSFTQANITAGDIIISAIKTENSGQDVYFTSTLEVEF